MNFFPNWISLPGNNKVAPVPSKPRTTLPSHSGSIIVVDNTQGQTNRSASKANAGQPTRPAKVPFSPSAKQLEILNFLAMPNGIRSSVLAEKLGWKTPSVRAAISRLRAAGYKIETLNSSTTEETIYRCRIPGKQSSLMPGTGNLRLEPDLGNVAARLEPAGAEAGAKFAAALKTEAERAGTVADTLKDRFSFNATPTISPTFSNGAASAAPVSRSSYQGGPAQVINQNVTGNSDPQRTARAVVREQNSAIRRARARSLHDLGALA